MLTKSPAGGGRRWGRFFGRSFAILAGLELASMGVCYLGYRRMNRDRDFRFWVSQNCYPLLEVYYQVGEKLGDSQTRQYDAQAWAAQHHITQALASAAQNGTVHK